MQFGSNCEIQTHKKKKKNSEMGKWLPARDIECKIRRSIYTCMENGVSPPFFIYRYSSFVYAEGGMAQT